MNTCTAIILHPRATPRPVRSIHPQSAEIERHGVTLGEYDIHLNPGDHWIRAIASTEEFLRWEKELERAKRHPQRSPRQINPGMIAEDAVARAYRLVRTLKADNPKVQAVLNEIAFRLVIANPFADR